MKYIFDWRENNGMMRKNVKVYENIYRWIIISNFEILECWRLFFLKFEILKFKMVAVIFSKHEFFFKKN